MKPSNKGHFSGPANVIRVQQWRQQNPGYWKRQVRVLTHAHLPFSFVRFAFFLNRVNLLLRMHSKHCTYLVA